MVPNKRKKVGLERLAQPACFERSGKKGVGWTLFVERYVGTRGAGLRQSCQADVVRRRCAKTLVDARNGEERRT